MSAARRGSTKGLGGERVEGRHAVLEALLGPRRVRQVLMAADLDPAPILDDIRSLASEQGVRVSDLRRAEFEAEAESDAPQGVLAHVDPLADRSLAELADRRGPGGSPPFLLVLDGLHDPGNLGAVFRTAEGAGVTGVVLPRHRSARVTAAVTKTAAGAVEHVPVASVGGVPAALAELKERGLWIVGLDEGGDQAIWDVAVATEPMALVLGNEARGLARLTAERCDVLARIPLQGAVPSLNVAAAAAVACFDVARRRQG